MSESFFSRWSRQKRAAAEPKPTAEQPDLPNGAAPRPAAAALGSAAATATATGPVPASVPAPATESTKDQGPLPTLDDVQALTPASDFQPFMQRGVGSEVRNAAMKKLFADPHFNVMDGLDIYIDDYSQPDPMPAGMLRKMASAQFLGLAPQEAPTQTPARPQEAVVSPLPAQGAEVVAQSPDSSACADTPPHDHPDLQLQPDPAPADPQPGPGPR